MVAVIERLLQVDSARRTVRQRIEQEGGGAEVVNYATTSLDPESSSDRRLERELLRREGRFEAAEAERAARIAEASARARAAVQGKHALVTNVRA